MQSIPQTLEQSGRDQGKANDKANMVANLPRPMTYINDQNNRAGKPIPFTYTHMELNPKHDFSFPPPPSVPSVLMDGSGLCSPKYMRVTSLRAPAHQNM